MESRPPTHAPSSNVRVIVAAANNIPHQVRKIQVNEVFGADELLLTSSTKEVLPVTTLITLVKKNTAIKTESLAPDTRP